MNNVVTVKVPLDLKEKMRKYKDRVKWSIELREFIKRRIHQLEAEDNLQKVIAIIEKTESVPEGFSSETARAGRDAYSLRY